LSDKKIIWQYKRGAMEIRSKGFSLAPLPLEVVKKYGKKQLISHD
jgi:hypothetical protein